MATMWIGPDENLAVGDKGFLIENSNQIQGRESWYLRDTPAYTNQSHEPTLYGWCGSYNDTSTYGRGMWEVVKVAKNGRAQIRELEGRKLLDALEELGYPELFDGEVFVRYVGCFVNDKNVAVYRSKDTVRLSAEKINDAEISCVPDKVLSLDQYEELRDKLVVLHNEAATTAAFLRWMGYDGFDKEE